ncbi:hypothetical protein llap_14016 [Limosa lapponica baueri]|uniref:Uncharacterized protein n=1 Tax=Limosa lapponica baueri TaxID=1758121 RepID=A0A2I0TPH4_LIMLA|nr:hypothetical protein llap_14016 [Limosa lapponica baueri]
MLVWTHHPRMDKHPHGTVCAALPEARDHSRDRCLSQRRRECYFIFDFGVAIMCWQAADRVTGVGNSVVSPAMKADRVCHCQEDNGVGLESPGGQIDLCKSSAFVRALGDGGQKEVN